VSSISLLKITAAFASTCFVGIGLVYAAGYFGGLFVKLPAAEAEVVTISINDKGFTPPQVDEDNPNAFDPEGIYSIVNKTKNVLPEIDSFMIDNKMLSVDCDDERFGSLVKATGGAKLLDPASTKEEYEFKNFSHLKISRNTISFELEAGSNVRYEFSGAFNVKGNFYTLDPNKDVVTGTLTKFVGDKKVSEAEVSFTWSIDLTCVC